MGIYHLILWYIQDDGERMRETFQGSLTFSDFKCVEKRFRPYGEVDLISSIQDPEFGQRH